MKKPAGKKRIRAPIVAVERSAHSAVLRNAVRLLEDARILRKARRYPSATALAVLSLEEVGKFRTLDEDLLFWSSEIHNNSIQGRKHLYAHKSKQRAAAEALIDGMGFDELRDLARAAGFRIILSKKREGVRPATIDIIGSITKSTFEKKLAGKIRRSKHHAFVIDLAKGEFDVIKQRSFYVDEEASGDLSDPAVVVDRLAADRTISLASGAIYTTRMTWRHARALRKSKQSLESEGVTSSR
ncbi:AbiV family abortive infection protein [Bradyrhizobium xenonodulans]|uniref:AbiV family abortive infection protein n=1 Tax=Bradyrhizobium xenonodulans TaxID=2736875 RepID=A0ABY7ML43_9BRAD|nr:AbiV family abortive infection protein [Bradyrhizobium xenonodulans]WBL77372.1 AbiV family abortive infection protein [Bradyrhizobium xenonodulans]